MVACGVLPGGVKTPSEEDARRKAVEQTLAARTPPVFVSRDRDGTRLWTQTREFYREREFALAWIDGKTGRKQMDDLIVALQHAERDGLDPDLYNVSTLAARRAESNRGFLTKKGFNESEAVGFDVWLTYLYLQYASDLTHGLADLSRADPNWQIRGREFDAAKTLRDALEQNTVSKSLDELTPQHEQYRALRDALQRYRAIADKGGWSPVPANLRVKPGQHNAGVAALARRLAATGDYSGRVDDNVTVYGPELQAAVKRFQGRHGFEPDGAVTPALDAELNVPIERRIAQIRLNLERWRWLPHDLGDPYILVNIPEYRLEVWDHGHVPLAMNVVVGKKDTPTPIFADRMTYLVFAPYWNVPPDIVEKETLPSVMNDPAFLQRANMEVVDKSGTVLDPASIDLSNPDAYRFRQRPGTTNSLGLVKFMFPNQYNVYLHDTPADSLFARATRSFSHGCVRVEQPDALAQYVLRDQPAWTQERIDEAMHGEDETIVKLKAPLPVYLGYWTARVSSDGLMQFRRDVYGVDGRQAALLTDRLTKLKARAAAAARAALDGDQGSRPTVGHEDHQLNLVMSRGRDLKSTTPRRGDRSSP
jgi:murein L,D-transpeptidase YcbB/YkuD